MKFTITCPDCGKVHEITVDEVKQLKPVLISRTEKTTSWAEIAEHIHSGNTELKVGDQIACTLKNGLEVFFEVAHLNPYDSNEVAFILKDCLPDRHCMNENGGNAGGYCESDMAMYLKHEIFPLLPDDLQAVIKERVFTNSKRGRNSILHCKLWLPSHTELGGEPTRYIEKDGVPFDLFKDEKSKVKQIDGETCGWWTRSPYAGNSSYFVYVYTNGSSYYSGANVAYGVAFGFLI